MYGLWVIGLALVMGFAQVEPSEEEVPTFVIDPALQPQIEYAAHDLATRLAIAPTEIEVLEAAPVTWSDGSLGCPAPDMAYIQILIDGALIRLRALGVDYEYHSGTTRPPFLCEQPLLPIPMLPDQKPPPSVPLEPLPVNDGAA